MIGVTAESTLLLHFTSRRPDGEIFENTRSGTPVQITLGKNRSTRHLKKPSLENPKGDTVPRTEYLAWVNEVATPENGISVGHYKPINSRRDHNDRHGLSSTSSKPAAYSSTGSQTVSRIRTKATSSSGYRENRTYATGVSQNHSRRNALQWVQRKQDIRDRGNIWFIPYETIREERPHPATFPVQLPVMCIHRHGIGRCISSWTPP